MFYTSDGLILFSLYVVNMYVFFFDLLQRSLFFIFSFIFDLFCSYRKGKKKKPLLQKMAGLLSYITKEGKRQLIWKLELQLVLFPKLQSWIIWTKRKRKMWV